MAASCEKTHGPSIFKIKTQTHEKKMTQAKPDPQTTINTLFWLLKDQSNRYNELAVTCAQNPCIEKKKRKKEQP